MSSWYVGVVRAISREGIRWTIHFYVAPKPLEYIREGISYDRPSPQNYPVGILLFYSMSRIPQNRAYLNWDDGDVCEMAFLLYRVSAGRRRHVNCARLPFARCLPSCHFPPSVSRTNLTYKGRQKEWRHYHT